MALIVPFLGTVFAPTLALALFIFALAFYRYKIEKYDDKDEPKQAKQEETEEIETSRQNCQCGKKSSCSSSDKIKRISIIYGTTTGM